MVVAAGNDDLPVSLRSWRPRLPCPCPPVCPATPFVLNLVVQACMSGPAFVQEAITVASIEPIYSTLSSFSDYGICTDIAAPGEGICSASYTGDQDYTTKDGTSMAT